MNIEVLALAAAGVLLFMFALKAIKQVIMLVFTLLILAGVAVLAMSLLGMGG